MPNVGAVPHVNPFHLKQHVFSDVSTVIRNPSVVADNRVETQRLRNMFRFSLHEVDQFLKKAVRRLSIPSSKARTLRAASAPLVTKESRAFRTMYWTSAPV